MSSNKKIKLIILNFVIIISSFSVLNVVSAAETMDGKATLTVVAPTTDALNLMATPNIDFGTATIGVSKGTLAGTTDKPYTIVDLRGGSTGYRIQVETSDFTLKSNNKKVLPVTSVMLNITNNTSGSLVGTGSDVDTFKQQAVVLTGNSDSNGTQTSGEVTAGLNLDFEKMGSLKVGEYQATVTHSIVSGIQ